MEEKVNVFKEKRLSPKLAAAILWGMVIGITILYISLIFNHNIWTDEAFTLQLLEQNITGILEGTARDVHPPLYYLYAKLFALFSHRSLLIQKLAAIIPMTATLVIGATVIRKNWGNRVSFLFVLFLTCIPCSMEFAVQVRMYSLALFFVTVCGIFAYLAFMDGKKKNFFVFALTGVLAAYTHYFAFVSVIVITGLLFLAILIWKRERITKWIISALSMVICYLPWMPSFIRQVRNVEQGYWIPEITAETIWGYFTWTFDLELIPGAVLIFLLLLKGASTYNIIRIALHKRQIEIFALFCMLVPVCTTLFGVIASIYRTPIYRDQYIFPALGLLALFFAIAMRTANKGILILISLFFLFVGGVQYKECYHQEYNSTYVPQTEAFFSENLQEADYVLYNWEAFDFIYECYFPKEQLAYSEEFDFSRSFHVVWFLDTEGMPEIDTNVLGQNGLIMEHMGHYGIEHNEFEIYKIYRESLD